MLFLQRNNNKNDMNVASMNNLWTYLQGLSLSVDNRHWLAERLLNPDEADTNQSMAFPKIPKNYKVSNEVLDMTCGQLPKDFDLESELEMMWEEFAK